MLPPDFRWIKPAATAYDETVIAHGDTWVVHIYQPERGREWVAMLDAHREPEGRRHRHCTAFANGKTGAELWVQREQARLRLEVQRAHAISHTRISDTSLSTSSGLAT